MAIKNFYEVQDALFPPLPSLEERATSESAVVGDPEPVNLSRNEVIDLIALTHRELRRGGASGDVLARHRLDLINSCERADFGKVADVLVRNSIKEASVPAGRQIFSGSQNGGDVFSGPSTEPLLDQVYAGASAFFAADDMPNAVCSFNLYVSLQPVSQSGLLGLSLCAIKLDRFDLGMVLGRESAGIKSLHPRVHFVVGVCALELGDDKTAKHHLALTTRIARRDPRHRVDLRAAQRILLLLQFADD